MRRDALTTESGANNAYVERSDEIRVCWDLHVKFSVKVVVVFVDYDGSVGGMAVQIAVECVTYLFVQVGYE